MGVQADTFVNNSAPAVEDTWLNSVTGEVNNIITGTGQTPSTGNLNQLGIASSIYAAGGEYYTDSGVADAYVLSAVGGKKTPNAYFTGMKVRFIVGNTNTGASTVNVATLGVKNIKDRDGSSAVGAGTLATGREITLSYDGTNFRIENGVAFAASIFPVGSMLDYAGTSAPSDWLLCYGQAVSRVTYAALFGVLGTAFGSGDGSTTFNVPDCRGRVRVGLDNLGGSSANRITNANADSLNNTGFGAETDTGTNGTTGATSLSTSQLPSQTLTVKIKSGQANSANLETALAFGQSGGSGTNLGSSSASDLTNNNLVTTSNGGGSHDHAGSAITMTTGGNAQPSIAIGVIIKY